MNYRKIALVLVCVMLLSGCAASAAAPEEPKTYMVVDTPVYIIANAYGNLIRTMDDGYPIKEILSVEGASAKLIKFNELPEETRGKMKDYKEGYNFLEFRFDYSKGKRYNFWYGAPTIEFKGSVRGLVDPIIAKEMRKNDSEKNSKVAAQLLLTAPYYEIIYFDPYNGGEEIKKALKLTPDKDKDKDRTSIDDLLCQLRNDALVKVYKEPEYIEAGRSILAKCKDADDKTKAVEIYNWIIKNIQTEKQETNGSALETLKNKKAQCFGFAYLFDALATGMGLDTYVVFGMVNNTTGHAWNVLQMPDGSEYAIDCIYGVKYPDESFVKLPDEKFSSIRSIWSNKDNKYIPFKDYSEYVLVD